MLSTDNSTKYIEHLKHWVQTQYSNTLIILDNRDEMLESHKEDLLHAIKIIIIEH